MVDWIAKKNIKNNYINKLLKICLETNQFTNNGENVKLLEKIIKKKFLIDDSKSVIVVTNGSVALHALTAGLSYTDKKKINWATQSFTFPPSAQSNLSTVKIIDVDDDYGLDLSKLDNSINGIIVTNIFGNVVNIEKYEKWANKNNKYLIFDNAATSYTFYKGKNCLNYGNGCTISFHHTKPFGFGEGGAIIVDKKYEKNIRCLNNFGIGLTDNYYVKEGNNNKMSEVSAVYIIQYLENNFDLIIKKHQDLYKYFKEQINKHNLNNFVLFKSYHDNIIIPSCLTIVFKESGINDEIIKILNSNNISARKYYYPLDKSKNKSNELFSKILCLPCNIDVDYKDINKIISILKKY